MEAGKMGNGKWEMWTADCQLPTADGLPTLNRDF